jgi:site-specific recombinase XerD
MLALPLQPLEQLLPGHIPIGLNGQHGSNRGSSCRIAANNDLLAINQWLAAKAHNPKTRQAYQKELERLLLWAIVERQKPLSSLTTDDCQAYLHFLKTLQADNSIWVAQVPSIKARGSWKPFQYRPTQQGTANTVLSLRSVNYAKTVISGCMDWLVRQNYLQYNNFADIAAVKVANTGFVGTQRWFSRQQIQQMLAYAESLMQPDTNGYYAQLRVVFILKFAFSTGLRLHELVAATYGDIECLEDAEGKQFFLRVVGKNQKLRKTSLPATFMADMHAYRLALGLNPNLQSVPEEEPLIGSLRQKASLALTPAALHKVLSHFFKQWQQHLLANGAEPRLVAKAKQASSHWLRHSYGSFLANDCQLPLVYIRDELGHASIATTSIYLHSDDKKRQQAVSTALAGLAAEVT